MKTTKTAKTTKITANKKTAISDKIRGRHNEMHAETSNSLKAQIERARTARLEAEGKLKNKKSTFNPAPKPTSGKSAKKTTSPVHSVSQKQTRKEARLKAREEKKAQRLAAKEARQTAKAEKAKVRAEAKAKRMEARNAKKSERSLRVTQNVKNRIVKLTARLEKLNEKLAKLEGKSKTEAE